MKAGQIAPATNKEPVPADLEEALKENKKAWKTLIILRLPTSCFIPIGLIVLNDPKPAK